MASMRRPREAPSRQAQGPWADLALHTLGWKAFQDLCAQVCEEVLKRHVEIHREAQEGGQDSVFLGKAAPGGHETRATIQCKFSAKADRRLSAADLTAEEANIRDLVRTGDADTYVFITSMGVDAPVAMAIKTRLRGLGVRKPHVLGREFLTLAIRASSRLRALVPQVYGLGDLSLILDERKAAQTKALLGHWMPALRVYVPTAAHRKAVRILSDHRIVLLLGNPASGKSTIAAILSTMAAETERQVCLRLDGPREFSAHWNPHEKNRFYWVDDAFGSNQLRDEYVQDWCEAFPKLQAAIEHGNRFVLTSRRHIYEAAKPRLGTRNLHAFEDDSAVVDVGALARDEREQMLHNHIKAGAQPRAWKRAVKPHLDAVAAEPRFLPGMAKRLADPAFTRKLAMTPDALRSFVSEPKEHLIGTIEELSEAHRAALALVFVHRGRLPVAAPEEGVADLVSSAFGVERSKLWRALRELEGSFVLRTEDGVVEAWVFDHPTILDAVTGILRRDAGMAEMFVRGARFEAFATSVVCAGATPIRDALALPKASDAAVVQRLVHAPDDPPSNGLLFAFLAERASDEVFRAVVGAAPALLRRQATRYWRCRHDRRLQAHARASALGCLPPDLHAEAAAYLEGRLVDGLDPSPLEDERLLAFLPPRALLRLSFHLHSETLCGLPDEADRLEQDADLDEDAGTQFADLTGFISVVRETFGDDPEVERLLDDADSAVDSAVERLEERQREKAAREEAAEADDDGEWAYLSRSSQAQPMQGAARVDHAGPRRRSVFSDVDE